MHLHEAQRQTIIPEDQAVRAYVYPSAGFFVVVTPRQDELRPHCGSSMRSGSTIADPERKTYIAIMPLTSGWIGGLRICNICPYTDHLSTQISADFMKECGRILYAFVENGSALNISLPDICKAQEYAYNVGSNE